MIWVSTGKTPPPPPSSTSAWAATRAANKHSSQCCTLTAMTISFCCPFGSSRRKWREKYSNNNGFWPFAKNQSNRNARTKKEKRKTEWKKETKWELRAKCFGQAFENFFLPFYSFWAGARLNSFFSYSLPLLLSNNNSSNTSIAQYICLCNRRLRIHSLISQSHRNLISILKAVLQTVWCCCSVSFVLIFYWQQNPIFSKSSSNSQPTSRQKTFERKKTQHTERQTTQYMKNI